MRRDATRVCSGAPSSVCSVCSRSGPAVDRPPTASAAAPAPSPAPPKAPAPSTAAGPSRDTARGGAEPGRGDRLRAERTLRGFLGGARPAPVQVAAGDVLGGARARARRFRPRVRWIARESLPEKPARAQSLRLGFLSGDRGGAAGDDVVRGRHALRHAVDRVKPDGDRAVQLPGDVRHHLVHDRGVRAHRQRRDAVWMSHPTALSRSTARRWLCRRACSASFAAAHRHRGHRHHLRRRRDTPEGRPAPRARSRKWQHANIVRRARDEIVVDVTWPLDAHG